MRTTSRRLLALLAGLSAVVAAAPVLPASAADSHALIQGSGSSWSSNAVNQWIADVQQNGLQVVFTSSGSGRGRKDFAYKTTDYAVSDIGYQGTDASGEADTSQGRSFSYLPVVAGGTAFPYQVRVGGQLVKNIRLSGLTLAKIFTNQVTDWSDQAITADNNGRQLPSLPIIPVVHSEGSGSTAQFTRYLAKQYPSVWQAYSGTSKLTEYYPRKGSQIAQDGSDGVMNFVSSQAGNGAIGYDEYSYSLSKGYPVVKLQNAAGYYTAPTQYNVAVALTRAQINMDKSSPDYLLQNLDAVYTHPDKRAYAMSSYSYLLIPTASDDPRMTTAKRQTLVDFLYYSVCQGQAEMGPIGYSPLPVNLAQASFDQIGKLKTADSNVNLTERDITTCHNPTFVAGQPTRNYLAEIAPQPSACDNSGAGPCTGNEGLVNGNPSGGKAPAAAAGSQGTSGTSAGGTGGTGGTSSAGGSTGGNGTAGGSNRSAGGGTGTTTNAAGSSGAPGLPAAGVLLGGTRAVDPTTGQPQVLANGQQAAGGAADLTAVPTSLTANRLGGTTTLLGIWAVLLLIAALAAPPLVASRMRRRSAS